MALTKVSTDGVKDDAITSGKIPANQIEASELADNAVDTNAIADQAVTLSKLPHGTSSNDGKFLRANNGADPTFETVTSTTINNNANNRVITGSGTANTLEGEANLTFDSSTDTLQVHQQNSGNNPAFKSIHRGGSGSNINAHFTNYSGTNHTVILHNGNVGIGTQTPNANLHVQVSGTDAPIAQFSSASYTGYVGTAHADNNIGNGSKAGNLVLRGQTGVAIMGNNGTTTQVKIDADGLKFGSDTAAANALDDYEEGTWTPSTTEGMNSLYGAHYVKVGSKVSVQAYIALPTSSSGSNIRIDSFPFTSKGSSHYAIGAAYSQWSGNDHIFIQMAPSATHAYIYKATGNSVTFSDGSGGYFLFSMTYFAA